MKRNILLLCMLLLQTAVLHAGRCTGKANCRACSNCSNCRYCNEGGGSCGACRGPGSGKSYSESVPLQDRNISNHGLHDGMVKDSAIWIPAETETRNNDRSNGLSNAPDAGSNWLPWTLVIGLGGYAIGRGVRKEKQ